MPAPLATSLIDQVDGHDHVVGQVERGSALAGGSFRTAHVFVLSGDSILLQELSASRRRYPGRWGSSVAAYLHAGETYESAARRRQHEELGLTAPLSTVGKLRMRDQGAWKFVTLFVAKTSQVQNHAPEEIAELRWWKVEDITRDIAAQPEAFTPTFEALITAFPPDELLDA